MKFLQSFIICSTLLVVVTFSACHPNGKQDNSNGIDTTAVAIDTTQTVTEDTTLAVADSLSIDSIKTKSDSTAVAAPSKTEPTKPATKATPPTKPKTPEKPKTTTSTATNVNKGVFKKWRMDTGVTERAGGYTYRVDGSFEAKPSRMWSLIDIKQDGNISKRGPGPTDAGETVSGRWKMVNPKELTAEYKDGTRQRIKIITVESGALVLKIENLQ
ncbi:MAG TPA: hypothetical protein PK230_00740 [Chitinophagales bacterium]|nr:hypothetical protein [Chitinophagales bacterium]